MTKHIIRIFLAVFCLSLGAALGVRFLLQDTRPAEFIARRAMARYFPNAAVSYGAISGNLGRGLVFKDVTISKDPHFPPGTVLKIQEVQMSGSLFGERWFEVGIDNGRLKLPVSDTILLNGRYARGRLQAEIFSPAVDLSEVRDVISRFKVNSPRYSGRLEQVDIRLEGDVPWIQVRGEFLLPNLVWERLAGQEGEGKVDMRVRLAASPRFEGTLDLRRGEIHGPKTAVVKLRPSRMIFKGELDKPVFSMKGRTRVSGVDIDVSLGGTPQQPDLQLSSDPQLPQGQLLAMLVTNKSWQGSEILSGKRGIPLNLAKDFVDYFALGGLGSELGKQFGIDDFSVTFDGQHRGFDLKKAVTRKMSAVYGVEESQPQVGSRILTQKLGGQYRIDETTTIGVERSFQRSTPSLQASPSPLDETIMFKIQKGF